MPATQSIFTCPALAVACCSFRQDLYSHQNIYIDTRAQTHKHSSLHLIHIYHRTYTHVHTTYTVHDTHMTHTPSYTNSPLYSYVQTLHVRIYMYAHTHMNIGSDI